MMHYKTLRLHIFFIIHDSYIFDKYFLIFIVFFIFFCLFSGLSLILTNKNTLYILLRAKLRNDAQMLHLQHSFTLLPSGFRCSFAPEHPGSGHLGRNHKKARIPRRVFYHWERSFL